MSELIVPLEQGSNPSRQVASEMRKYDVILGLSFISYLLVAFNLEALIDGISGRIGYHDIAKTSVADFSIVNWIILLVVISVIYQLFYILAIGKHVGNLTIKGAAAKWLLFVSFAVYAYLLIFVARHLYDVFVNGASFGFGCGLGGACSHYSGFEGVLHTLPSLLIAAIFTSPLIIACFGYQYMYFGLWKKAKCGQIDKYNWTV
jgi:hypothetical protein